MLAPWLTSIGITRDSALWLYGKVAGAIVFIVALGAEQASSYFGVPAGWFHALQIAAAWIVYFSAQQSTSQLPGAPPNS